jgi:hypothetical protein
MNNCPPFKILRFLSLGLIFLISIFTAKTFAIDNSTLTNSIAPIIADGFDVGKLVNIFIGWLFGLLVALLWIVSRLLSVLFKFLGGIMYGFFVNNPLDTELEKIRLLWSFLVDFGNLLVVFSFIALAITYLFDIKLPGITKDIGKFFGGIVVIALLLNFSLTFTSAFVTTVHNIGIGSIFFTLDNTQSAKLDLSSKRQFNKDIRSAGFKFFDSVTNNFVESVSCLGTTGVTTKQGTKTMAEICEFHKKDLKEQLGPINLITSSDGTPQATNFYLTAIIREVMTIILLAVAIWVIIILLKVAIFRIAYLWLVGIFAGPALVAAFSPFESLQKYFKTWLKWLVTFSTMMIIFVYGFYLSSYIATLEVDNKDAGYEALPSILENPGYFVTVLVNNMISLVVPNIMFPIVGLAILYLLGKYLDETYQTHAASALKAGGQLVSNARKGVADTIAAPGRAVRSGLNTAGNIAKAGAGAGGVLASLPNRIGAGVRGGLGNAGLAGAAVAGAMGAKNLANRLEGDAVSSLGKAAASKQRAQQKVQAFKDFAELKGMKENKAEQEYLGKMNNIEMLKAMGVSESQIAEEAKKAGVSQKVLQQGQEMASTNKYATAPNGKSFNDSLKEAKMSFAQESNKDFYSQLDTTKENLTSENQNQKKQAAFQYETKRKEMETNFERENKDITDLLNSDTITDSEKNKLRTKQTDLQNKNTKESAKLSKNFEETLKQLETSEEEISDIAANIVNTKYLEENPNINQKATKAAIESNRDLLQSGESVQANKKSAAEKADKIDAASELVFAKLKAVDDMDKAETDPNKRLSTAKKEAMRKAILESSVDSQQGGAYTTKIKRLAEQKYREFKANPYETNEK